LLVLFSLITPAHALDAVSKGTDVYLFLIGMMLLAELARREGVFDWLASVALEHARGSGQRLFVLVYAVGILVTVFLSNDATAVVLTPAVYAVAKHAKVPALPYLLICAFIANAASFVLPISNPANLVVFGDQMPRLGTWVREFALASLVSIVSTYLLLRWTQRKELHVEVARATAKPVLSTGGGIAAGAIVATGVVLLAASLLGWQLGLPTCLAGLAAWVLICSWNRSSPWPVLGNISWSVLPLVAGLFVLVRAVEDTGAFAPLVAQAAAGARQAPHLTALVGGSAVAVASNLINNLPMGLIGATVVQAAHVGAYITGAILIGVDLGPNLSITGSLATILWLVAIRREGEEVSAARFLAVGAVVMPLSLLATLACYTWA
jgi:arsenical pump membrane protein